MRIAKIEDFAVDGGWRTNSFLKVMTEEGSVGWSEYVGGWLIVGVTDLIHRFADIVIGMDPREVGRITSTLHAGTRAASSAVYRQAMAAIENACLDIKAKALGVPVYRLFGGPFREKIPLYWSHCGSIRSAQHPERPGQLDQRALLRLRSKLPDHGTGAGASAMGARVLHASGCDRERRAGRPRPTGVGHRDQ